MDFDFTPEQEMLRKTVREFAEKEIVPKMDWMDETGEVPIDTLEKMAKLGFMGVLVPKEYGGLGMGHIERMILLEEIGRVSPAMANTVQVHHLGTAPIAVFGTEEQKKELLRPLAKGEKIATFALTEPTGGSDVLGVQTTAKLDGNNYVINGRKCFISNTHIADVIGVAAKTGEGTKGLSVFIIESNTPGFKPGRKEDKFGLRGCNTGELVLKNCKVPKENIIGKEGDGLKVALASISNVGRPGITAAALGIVQACLEEAVKYSKQRILYGKPISDLQAIQWHLADIYMDYETSKLLTYRAAWLRDKGERCDAENAMAKFWATEAAVRCAQKTVTIFGAYGCMKELVPQRLLRDAWLFISGAGTSEIMRIVMARQALKRA
ncbi:MAG: acyl-CoA dehydrogenase family protein [Candidatus Bathyarchaeota archaeon]|nr:MAG: acyl-CoA dehydrogenase family protein [Candidatus Bathyarchaeota archaeon]